MGTVFPHSLIAGDYFSFHLLSPLPLLPSTTHRRLVRRYLNRLLKGLGHEMEVKYFEHKLFSFFVTIAEISHKNLSDMKPERLS